jgi:spore coat polysaccharide biosynthesis protein SpsF (cytidylyltransferase family)
MRVTVDTAEDYRRAQTLYAALDGAPYADPRDRYTGEAVIGAYRRVFPRIAPETAQEAAQTP